jgi:hypothetical protein
VDAFRVYLEVGTRAMGLGLAPQLDRPLQKLALLRRATFLDHPLEACKLDVCVGPIGWHLSISVLRDESDGLFPIAQQDGHVVAILSSSAEGP